MKLAYVHLCGFRGYRKPIHINFAERFTVIDGRNGVGKSTVFDAIEFALTGTISKYGDAKAAGESVADYLWWTGEGPAPKDRFVEVGFRDGTDIFPIRRSEFGRLDADIFDISDRLCETTVAPKNPLIPLCAASIIRDEHIASLSLDLKEADRYALLRNTLGANDADVWIGRAYQILNLAKRRVGIAQQEVTAANSEVANASRRIDEVRVNMLDEPTVSQAVERLRKFSDIQGEPDSLAGPVRERIASFAGHIEALQLLIDQWNTIAAARLKLEALAQALSIADQERATAAAELETWRPGSGTISASELAGVARDLVALVTLGRKLGLQDGQCPLCAKGQSHTEFSHGTAIVEDIARRIDEEAVRQAKQEQALRKSEMRLIKSEEKARSAASEYSAVCAAVATFDRQMREQGLDENSTIEQVSGRLIELRHLVDGAQKDLRILETLRLSGDLGRAQRAEADAKNRLARVQERFSRALKAEAIAQALYDAARRAAGETIDRRLDRILPLMSELYRRLRPHPIWRDIEYSIRGDVKRFLKLQVGEDLNPQFLFSSGQRRATGLAFLLSVNISLAWSRWRSILLDDPVQHVDDFRTVHLAEVTAQLVSEGRQIIVAVEDAALADLLCRRLPLDSPGEGKRVTLGSDQDGALSKLTDRELMPLARQSLFATATHSVAS
jgi:chromosome segregation protein